MASRQLPEGWNHQSGSLGIKGKAGETQAIRPAAQAGHRMQMTADVEQISSGLRFWSMA
tara:strand:+ start:759 stop:935 length:177 start_codon:yes stop_codon:yes gene_type:complete